MNNFIAYRCLFDHFAYFWVHSFAFARAVGLLFFHWSAASLFKGSSGLGSDNKLWIDRSTDFTWRAGDQFFFKISKQILPKLSNIKKRYTDVGMIDLSIENNFGWGHWVVIGDQDFSLELSISIASSWRAWSLYCDVPSMMTKKCLKLSGSGVQIMPGTGSDWRVFVSFTSLGLGPCIFVDFLI